MPGRIECPSCHNEVIPRHVFGLYEIFLVLFTAGLWLLLLPFEEKHCPRCRKVMPKKQ